MRPRQSRVLALWVSSLVLVGLLAPGPLAEVTRGITQLGADIERSRTVRATLPAGPPVRPAVGLLAAVPADLPVEPPPQPPRPEKGSLFGADCQATITGSHVTAYCHNRYPAVDLVRLHIECDRWWDLDGDSAAVPVGPAAHVRLAGRCWKEVRRAWLTHERG
ncbi:hypothetical protein [Streptomyces sp. NPDC006879]|uniref:hypothetical protein n=1 Tax=Streptomyces sp. NPDC006879 TaxID=3364767 RepID=UPI0036B4E3FD